MQNNKNNKNLHDIVIEKLNLFVGVPLEIEDFGPKIYLKCGVDSIQLHRNAYGYMGISPSAKWYYIDNYINNCLFELFR